ncbi:redoxin domain-containing protein [Verrucomicrobiaceae bacterium 5K15]|uniref:thioredoxin-dependent peroxiredoxin n=1 Tax=Oceaniferula flava TaxID=2800421 RepID=A0AAE2S9W2_9BACT|nr:redoxin domain-containing protein [Oceaniferula flavus]MBK1854090.1 redoxin domain-containing protein [Oceaniferula flavus]MBM1135396.1 redoxin domain-containing protein [Oceaniferula flavus]
MKISTATIAAITVSLSTQFIAAQGLQDKLDARKNAFLKRAPEGIINSQKKALRELEVSGIYARVLKVGDKAPDFTLGNPDGQQVRLATLLKQGPVVLTWYRGGWCPYCNIALAELSEKNDSFKKLGATLVALTPELPDATAGSVKDHGLNFEVLSDLNHAVAEQYGLVFTLNKDTRKRYQEKFKLEERSGKEAAKKLPLPATYVIDTDGTITYAFIDADYRRRAEPARIVDALKAIKDGPSAKHLLLQFWENTWNPPYDLDLIDRNMSEDFVLTSAGKDIQGRDAFKAWVKASLEKANGLRIENLDSFENADGSRVVSRWITRANTGAVPDSDQASHQPFEFTGIALWAFEDGKLTHNWVERSASKVSE